MGKHFRRYDIIGTTILEMPLPTSFSFIDYFSNTLSDRVTKGYEDEFKTIGITKVPRKGKWSNTKYNMDRDIFLDQLDYTMHEKRFLVSVDDDNLPSFNVPITDNVLCTIHPGQANKFNVWGTVRSVKTRGYAYRQIWKSLEETEYHPYAHVLKVLEELNGISYVFEQNRKTILQNAQVKQLT